MLKIYFLFLSIPFVFLIFCSVSIVYFSTIFNFLLTYSKSDNFYNFNLCKSFLQTSTHIGLFLCRFSDFFFSCELMLFGILSVGILLRLF